MVRRRPGADLLRGDPDEDRALREIEWPLVVEVGSSLLGVALGGGVIVAALFAPGRGADVDPAGVTLVAASGVPWIVCLWLASQGSARGDERRRTWPGNLGHAHLALVPLAVAAIGGALGLVDLGSDAAYHFVAFQVVLIVAVEAVDQARPTAILIAAGGYLVVVMGLVAATRHTSDVDWTGLVAWQVALLITVGATFAVRQGLLAMHRSREILAQQAIATERRRIARDVHDVVAHTLAVTMLHMTAARMAAARGSLEGAADALTEAERHGRASLADVRRIVGLLRADDTETPSHGPHPDLSNVAELVDGYRAAGLPVELSVAGRTDRVPPARGLAVYRVLQEALTNAARHGTGPAHVDLRIAEEEGDGPAITLLVDNPVSQGGTDRPGGPGNGLLGMRERIAAAGGTVTAGRDDGRWSVRARVPLGRAPTAEPPPQPGEA